MKKGRLFCCLGIFSLFLTGCELPEFLNNDFFSFLKKDEKKEEEKSDNENKDNNEQGNNGNNGSNENNGNNENQNQNDIVTGTELTIDELIEAFDNRPESPYTNVEITYVFNNNEPVIITDTKENNWNETKQYVLIPEKEDLLELKEEYDDITITKTYYGYEIDLYFEHGHSLSKLDESFFTLETAQELNENDHISFKANWWYDVSGKSYTFKEYDIAIDPSIIIDLDSAFPGSTITFNESLMYYSSGVQDLVSYGNYTQNKNTVSYVLDHGILNGNEMPVVNPLIHDAHLLGNTLDMKIEGMQGATFAVFTLDN